MTQRSTIYINPAKHFRIEFHSIHNMAEQSSNTSELPERPKEEAAEGEKGPSKGALKKAAKEKEKVRLSRHQSTTNANEPHHRQKRQRNAKPKKQHKKQQPTPMMSRKKITVICP